MRQKAKSKIHLLPVSACADFMRNVCGVDDHHAVAFCGCEGFPSVEEVKQVLAEHDELAADRGCTPAVFVHLTPCPGGAFITIEYGGISEKMEIEEVLEAAGAKEEGTGNVLWEFFGVPYGWSNT